MAALIAILSLILIALVLFDSFESILLPRRVTRNLRLARVFYRSTWAGWAALARLMKPGKRRQTYLSLFGPLSMLGLFALWVTGFIVGFALLQWSIGTPLNLTGGRAGLLDYLYMSGVTFFTLGFGDVTPRWALGRFLAVLETGLGFGFLAVIISYLPVLYQAFSRREATISLLDARAGSPPTTGQLLLRLAPAGGLALLNRYFEEWERWAAEVLESHLSFPVLAYYRSQHDNQSWLAALTLILDASALIIAGLKNACPYQARLTFAMARHTVVDLAQVFQTPPLQGELDRFPEDRLHHLLDELRTAGLDLRVGAAIDPKMIELRGMYEPFLNALARHFLLSLPPVLSDKPPVDNWQTSAWMRRTSGIGRLGVVEPEDDHAD